MIFVSLMAPWLVGAFTKNHAIILASVMLLRMGLLL